MIINKQQYHQDETIIIDVKECYNLDMTFHFHLEHYELTYLEGGNGIALIGDRILEFSGHDLILIPPGFLIHGYHIKTKNYKVLLLSVILRSNFLSIFLAKNC